MQNKVYIYPFNLVSFTVQDILIWGLYNIYVSDWTASSLFLIVNSKTHIHWQQKTAQTWKSWKVSDCSLLGGDALQSGTGMYWLHHLPWIWRQQVHPKYWYVSTKPYRITSKETVSFIYTTVRISNQTVTTFLLSMNSTQLPMQKVIHTGVSVICSMLCRSCSWRS